MRYTIESASPTGKVDPTYGTEYLITVNEDNRSFKMNRKFSPKIGAELIGDIVQASWGSYFKKDSSEQNNASYSSDSQKQTQKPERSDRAMYVSYAKDLAIAYLNFIDWDYSRFEDAHFESIVQAVSKAATTLSES